MRTFGLLVKKSGRGRTAATVLAMVLLLTGAAGTAQADTRDEDRSGSGSGSRGPTPAVVDQINAQADAARSESTASDAKLTKVPKWARTAARTMDSTGSMLVVDDSAPTGKKAEPTVPGGKTKVRDLLRKSGAERGSRDTATAQPKAAGPDDDMTVQECVNRGRSQQGYGKSRFVTCQAQRLHMLHVDCWWLGINCQVKAAADVTVADIRYTQNAGKSMNGRYFWNYQFLTDFNVWGDLSKLSLTVDESCTAQTVGGHASGPCQGTGSATTQTMAAWYAEAKGGPGYTWTVRDWEQPASAGWGPDRLSYSTLRWHYRVRGAETEINPDGRPTQVRCDSASYMYADAGEGCVFPWVTETMWFSLGQQGGSAKNVQEGLYSPSSTVPTNAGKTIPGRPGTTPLHRTRDTNQVDAHRREAIGSCDTYFPGYRGKGEQCDEFPFASTLEGATGAKNYSVKAISRSDNASGGAVEKNFWTYRRIVSDDQNKVNDAFWVDVRS